MNLKNNVFIRLWQADKVTASLTGLFLIYGLIFYFLVGKSIPISGDERYYFKASKAFADIYIAFFQFDWEMIYIKWDSRIIDRGWFIPSTSLIISPLRLFTDNLSLIRLFLFLINFFLTFLIICLSLKNVGKLITRFFIISAMLTPLYTIYSFTFWGGSIAGRLLTILIIIFYAKRHLISTQKLFFIGLILGIMLLFRGSLILIAPSLLFYIAIENFKEKQYKFKNLFFNKLIPITLSTVLVIVPWSIAISLAFAKPTLSVTSSNFSYIHCCANKSLKEEFNNINKVKSLYRKIYLYYKYKANGDKKLIYNIMKKDNIVARNSISLHEAMYMAKKTFHEMFLPSINSTFLSRYLNKYIVLLNFYFNKILFFSLLTFFLIIFSSSIPCIFSIFIKTIFIGALIPHFILFAGHSRHILVLIPTMLFVFSYLVSGQLFKKENFKYDFSSPLNWIVMGIQVLMLSIILILLFI